MLSITCIVFVGQEVGNYKFTKDREAYKQIQTSSSFNSNSDISQTR
jgi:hypothetical protein